MMGATTCAPFHPSVGYAAVFFHFFLFYSLFLPSFLISPLSPLPLIICVLVFLGGTEEEFLGMLPRSLVYDYPYREPENTRTCFLVAAEGSRFTVVAREVGVSCVWR